jgi:hypothetical protein
MDPFALLKRWSLGTYLRRQHIDSYLNEFVFRYNRRFYRHVSFETVLGDAPRAGSLPSSSGKTLAKLPRQSGDSHAIARQPADFVRTAHTPQTRPIRQQAMNLGQRNKPLRLRTGADGYLGFAPYGDRCNCISIHHGMGHFGQAKGFFLQL